MQHLIPGPAGRQPPPSVPLPFPGTPLPRRVLRYVFNSHYFITQFRYFKNYLISTSIDIQKKDKTKSLIPKYVLTYVFKLKPWIKS